LEFDADHAAAETIRDEDEYSGTRVQRQPRSDGLVRSACQYRCRRPALFRSGSPQ
jgi:hypothetical protein